VVPIYAGYDPRRGEGRIFKYDIAGGKYEETEFYSTGSGGRDARNTMKKFFRKDLEREEAICLALEALYDAADEDIATGGPDLVRGIFPTVKTITKSGVEDASEELIVREFTSIIDKRRKG
jgi:proteasome beta subunit